MIVREHNFLDSNLQIIKHKDRELFSRLRKVKAKQPPFVEFFPSKGGPIIARLQTDEGKEYLLHSYYDPLAEGEGVVKRINWRGVTHVLILGFGCGYHVRAILNRVGEDVEVYVIEPDVTLFKAVIENMGMKDILSHKNLKLFVGLQPMGVVGMFYKVFKVQDLKSIEVVKHPVYARLVSRYFNEVERRLKEAIRLLLTNLITSMVSTIRDQRNMLYNIDWIVKSPGVGELFGRFRGRPAVVVSAGPSLDKNIYYLRGMEDRVLIVSTDTGMNALLSHGIRPHIVAVGDPFESDYNCFMFTPPEEEEGIWLVADPRVTPRILNHWGGSVMIGELGSRFMNWLKQFVGDKGTLVAWGSVATQAMSIAVNLGANPLIFIGQDLSFVDGRKYASYTYGDYLGNNYVPLNGKGFTLEKDLFDRDVPTVHNMKTYRDWFNQQISQLPITVINATEGGIMREGVICMSLREALEIHAKEPFYPRETINKMIRYPKADRDAKSVRDGLRQLLTVVDEIYNLAVSVQKEIDEVFGGVEDPNKLEGFNWNEILFKLESSEKELRALMKKGRFVGDGFFVILLNFGRLMDNARKNPDEVKRNAEQVASYMELFKGVEQIALKYRKMLCNAIDKLNVLIQGVKVHA